MARPKAGQGGGGHQLGLRCFDSQPGARSGCYGTGHCEAGRHAQDSGGARRGKHAWEQCRPAVWCGSAAQQRRQQLLAGVQFVPHRPGSRVDGPDVTGRPALGLLPACCHAAPRPRASLENITAAASDPPPAAGTGLCSAEEKGRHLWDDQGAGGAHASQRAARWHRRVVGPRLPARQELQPGADVGCVRGGGVARRVFWGGVASWGFLPASRAPPVVPNV